MVFEAHHGFDEPAPLCPSCGGPVKRLIKQAAPMLRGMAAPVSKYATKEELRAKWAEETPKLRKKLADKLGEERVLKNAPTLRDTF
jgi:hypothetical protein